MIFLGLIYFFQLHYNMKISYQFLFFIIIRLPQNFQTCLPFSFYIGHSILNSVMGVLTAWLFFFIYIFFGIFLWGSFTCVPELLPA